MSDSKLKEKEREARLKALRKELADEIEQDLAIVGARHASPLPRGEETEANLPPKRILEALLFATAKPLTVEEIRKILSLGCIPLTLSLSPVGGEGRGEGEKSTPTTKEIKSLLLELKEEYQREGRSFELIEIAGGFEVVTRKEYAPWLGRLEFQRKARQATSSALETLAILAYKQPVTRAEIEELRGVDISGILSALLEKGFIKIAGKKEVPGRPFLYGTTEKFLEHFGLKSLAGLPSIGEIKSLIERAVKKEGLIDGGGPPS